MKLESSRKGLELVLAQSPTQHASSLYVSLDKVFTRFLLEPSPHDCQSTCTRLSHRQAALIFRKIFLMLGQSLKSL